MNDRAKLILEKSVQDFIQVGRPITSAYLYEKYNFGIKPAMIRRELHYLDRAGYLSQAHVSSGRVPTDKAYKFFVQRLLEVEGPLVTVTKTVMSIVQDFISGEKRLFANELSDYLKLLSVVYEPRKENIYNSGLQNLFNSIESEHKKDLGEVIRDFESLPDRLCQNTEWWTQECEWPQVFIGANPVTRSRHLAVVAERVTINSDEILLLAIGPRRMNYRRPIELFRFLQESLLE